MSFKSTRLVKSVSLAALMILMVPASVWAQPGKGTHTGARGGRAYGSPVRPIEVQAAREGMELTRHYENNVRMRELMGKTIPPTAADVRAEFRNKTYSEALKQIDTELEAHLKVEEAKRDANWAKKFDDLTEEREKLLKKASVFEEVVDAKGNKRIVFKITDYENFPGELARRRWQAIMDLLNGDPKALAEFLRTNKTYTLKQEEVKDAINTAAVGLKAKVDADAAKIPQGPAREAYLARFSEALGYLESYAKQVLAGTMKPSEKLVENVDAAINALRAAKVRADVMKNRGATAAKAANDNLTNMTKSFEEGNAAHIIEAERVQADKAQVTAPHELNGQARAERDVIMSDPDAAKGLGRLAAQFLKFNNAFKGDSAKVGEAMDSWVRASERERKALSDPKNYKEAAEMGVEAWLAKFRDLPENAPHKAEMLREREENEKLRQKICANCPKLVNMACKK